MNLAPGSHDLCTAAGALTCVAYPTDQRYEEERAERKAQRRRERNRDRQERDEYSDDSEDEYAERPPKMLEGASQAGTASEANFVRDGRERRAERDRDREMQEQYMSGGLGRRDDVNQQGY